MILPNQPDTLGITTQDFLNDLRGSNAQIFVNVDNKTWSEPRLYSQIEPTLKWLNDKKNLDICFIPNSGGKTNSSIDLITSCFIDWDCGRDGDGKYFELETVNQKKLQFCSNIDNSPLVPTYVIETRNGYQLYWFVEPGMTKEQFTDMQKRLIAHYDSDPCVHNPCRVMRLPGYYWVKPHSGFPRFFVRFVHHRECRYQHFQLLNAFPSITSEKLNLIRNKNKGNKVEPRISAYNNNRIIDGTLVEPVDKNQPDDIFANGQPVVIDREPGRLGSDNCDKGNEEPLRKSAYNNSRINKDKYSCTYCRRQKLPKPITTKGSYGSKLIEIIKQQDLAQYLNVDYAGVITEGQGITINCIFHNDKSPSASIFQGRDGNYIYKCHSPSCSFGSGSIIDVVSEVEGISEKEAIGKLIRHYGLEEKWKEEQRRLMEHNIDIVNRLNEPEQKETYPNISWMIGRITNDLTKVLLYAKKHITLRTNSNQNMFFCSLRHFNRLKTGITADKRIQRMNERIDRFALLGLIRKLPDEQISEAALNRAKQEKDRTEENLKRKDKWLKNKYGIEKDRVTKVYRTQFYSVCEYTEELLMKAEEIARVCKEAGVKMNSISRDMVLLVFGREKAREVYPQVDSEELSPSGQDFIGWVESALMTAINAKGYAREAEIVERLHTFGKWQSLTDRRVKKYLPALMMQNDLVQVSANKEHKAKFRIDSKGYPKIIIRKNPEANVLPAIPVKDLGQSA